MGFVRFFVFRQKPYIAASFSTSKTHTFHLYPSMKTTSFAAAFRTIALSALLAVASLASTTSFAQPPASTGGTTTPPKSTSHEEETKSKKTVSRGYSTQRPRPVQFICPDSSATGGEAFGAEGVCPTHKRTLIKEGNYYCPNHNAKQDVQPGKCNKCKSKLVVSWPRVDPYKKAFEDAEEK